MTQETSEPRTTDSGPDEGPGDQEPAAQLSPTGTSTRRVPLLRLLSVVVLSPAQASLVAVELLHAAREDPTGAGAPATDACAWAVALTSSGDVEVVRAPADEGSSLTELLGQLSRNARRLPAHPRPEQLELLRRLEQTAVDEQPGPEARARQLEGTLADVLGPGARQRLREQLAALVGAFAHIAPSVGVPVAARVAPGVSRPGPRRPPPARSRPGRPPWRGRAVGHRRARTRRMTAVTLLVVVALAGSGYVAFRDTDTGEGGASGRDDSRVTPTTTAPRGSSTEPVRQARSRSRPDVGSIAGRQAGAITGLQVQKAGACTPGAPCPVTVTVGVRSTSSSRPVVWRVGTARSCDSPVTWSGPVTMTAQPGWTSVYASSSVAVPEGRSPVLVALTTAPARAQSPPVPVAGSSLRC